MKKFVNVRTPVIVALALCAGIVAGITLYFYKLSSAWIALAILPAALIIAVLFGLKRKMIKPVVLVTLPLILFIGGALNAYFALTRFSKSEITADREYYVQGVVKEMGKTTNGEYIIIANVTTNGKKIGGKTYVYLSPSYGELCDVGYKVSFFGTLEKIEPFQYGELSGFTEENIKYRSSVFAGLKSTYGYSFFGSIRSSLRNNLSESLDRETAAITYAMLTGNTQSISEESLDSFRYGGVAHIFAVSGLHIGLVFGIFSFIMKKLRVKRYISAAVCLCAVFFYVAVCGFTLSALRAAIMCTVATIAGLLREKYDGLNSLAVAVIILLSITPLSLLSVGFQLSVCAVGGIFCLSKCIAKVFNKIKIPKPVGSAVGVSMGAQLGTMPVMLSKFGYLSGAGLILNLVVLPAMSAEFVLLFIINLLCLFVPPAAPVLLPYAAMPLEFIMSIFIGAGFEKALISGFGAGAFVIIYFIGVLALSDKINLKALTRIIALACSVVILTSYVLVRVYSPFNGYAVIISAYDKGGEILIKSRQGTLLIVTDDVNAPRLQSMLNRNYSGRIDALIILGDNSASSYADLGFNCDTVYVWNENQFQPYGDVILKYEENFTVCGVNCTFIDQNTLLADVGGIDIGVCADVNVTLKSCDIFVSDDPANLVDCGVNIFFNDRSGTLNIFDCGDIKFRIDDGKFRLKN